MVFETLNSFFFGDISTNDFNILNTDKDDVSFDGVLQHSNKNHKNPQPTREENLESVLKEVSTSNIVDNSNKQEEPNFNFKDEAAFSDKTNPLAINSKTTSEIDKSMDKFDVVEVVHFGKFDFKTEMNSVKFVDDFEVPKTIVQVKIPVQNIIQKQESFDFLYGIMYNHLYTIDYVRG